MTARKKKKFLLIFVAIVALGAAVAGWYFYQTIWHEETSDSSITKVESEPEDTEGTVDASLKYAGYVTLFNDEKKITLNFTNPKKSKKSLDLEIVADINGETITLAKTAKIRPGYKIDSVKSILDYEIPEGNYKGKFIIHFYDSQGKEEIINSEITINIYVK